MSSLQDRIKDHLRERNWDKAPPGDFVKSISIEAAELLEHFQWCNPTAEELKADQKKIEEVQREIADVIIYAIETCVVLDLDYEQITVEKLLEAQKKYPADKVQGLGADYYRHKENHRKMSRS